jgi:hypothetical protein
MSWRIRALTMAGIAALLMIAPPEFRYSAGTAAIAQDQGDGVEPAFLTTFSGGAVEAKLARTQTTAQGFAANGFFLNVATATLVRFVPFLDSDLFNVSFSAECVKTGGGVLLIRVLDNGLAMQPDDGFQIFCSSPTFATYSRTWVRRAGGGILGLNHTLQVQVRPTVNTATLDDWTLELVVYN